MAASRSAPTIVPPGLFAADDLLHSLEADSDDDGDRSAGHACGGGFADGLVALLAGVGVSTGGALELLFGAHAASLVCLTPVRKLSRILDMRTPKQQTRFEAATRRAQQIAIDRHRRLEARRIAKLEQEIIDNFIGDIATYVGAKA